MFSDSLFPHHIAVPEAIKSEKEKMMYKLLAILLLSSSITTSVSATTPETTTAPEDSEINLVETLFNNQYYFCQDFPDCSSSEQNAIEPLEESQEYSEPEVESNQQTTETE